MASSYNFDDLYSVRVYGISDQITKEDLTALFDKYGKVEDVFIPRNRSTGENQPFCFVRYVTEEEGREAAKEDGTELKGIKLQVEYVGRRPPRRDRYRSRSRSYHRHHHSRSYSRSRSPRYSRSRSHSRHARRSSRRERSSSGERRSRSSRRYSRS